MRGVGQRPGAVRRRLAEDRRTGCEPIAALRGRGGGASYPLSPTPRLSVSPNLCVGVRQMRHLGLGRLGQLAAAQWRRDAAPLRSPARRSEHARHTVDAAAAIGMSQLGSASMTEADTRLGLT